MTPKPFQSFRSKLFEEIRTNIKDLSDSGTSTSYSKAARDESRSKSNQTTGDSTETSKRS